MSKASSAVNPNRVLVIRASAGTGKTFQLTNCLLRLLLRGAKPSAILATTFTRKAAGEILDRVLERLAKATASDTDAARLAIELGEGISITRERVVELLARLMRQIDQLRISTLDAYFQKAAQSYAFELGLPFGWDVLNEDETELVQNDAIRRVLRESSPGEIIHLMHLLDKGNMSWKVASHIRATINAARSIFLRCAEGAWKKIEPRKGLSEAELAEALFALEGLTPPKKAGKPKKPKEGEWADEGNSFFTKELEKALSAARKGDFEYFLTKGVGKAIFNNDPKFQKVEIPEDWRLAYEKWVEHAIADYLKWLSVKNEATAELLSKFETQHELAKRIRRQFAFDDIPRALAKTLRSEESHQRLAFRLDAGVEYLLLDEFQDTSAEQWRVLAPMAQKVCCSKNGVFLCVGDVKQAIYGWRGGSSKIFAAIESELPNAKIEYLVESYRSSPPVIDAVNLVMEKLSSFEASDKDITGIREWAVGFKTHATAKKDLPGYVTLREVAVPVDDSENEGKATRGANLLAALECAAQIAKETHQTAPGRTIAILLRRNEPIGRMVHLLRQRGLEASEEGGASLLDSAAVETVLSLLQLADHPGDSVARFHLETGPLGTILFQELQTPSLLAAKLRKSLLEDGYGAFTRQWAQRLGPCCDLRDANRLQQLVELATEYESNATLRPSDFARYVTKKKVADVAASTIRVMTIHQAKGLEFDTVILPELEIGFRGHEPQCVAGAPHFLSLADRATRYVEEAMRPLIPVKMQEDHEDDRTQRVQDSLCMLYVAMTRAIHALHMIIPESKSKTNSSWSDLIRFALANGKETTQNALLFSRGDPLWFSHTPQHVQTTEASSKTAPSWPSLSFTETAPARSRNLSRVRPSQAAIAAAFNAYAAFSPTSTEATRYGTAIHYWCEQIDWLDSHHSPKVGHDLMAKGVALPGDDVQKWRSRFDQYITNSDIAAFFTQSEFRKRFNISGELTVHNEKSLVFLDEGALISGQIDRLVIESHKGRPHRAWILDFKTDAIDANSKSALAERIAHHTIQLQTYTRGISATYHLPLTAVEAYLVMLEAGIISRVLL
jgi:ATP-dependent helicase/nuclease subunit A